MANAPAAPRSYYEGREAALGAVFGAARVEVGTDHVVLDGVRHPVVDDVIVMLPIDRVPPRIAARITETSGTSASEAFAEDIQFTFGEEWVEHGEVLPEHEQEFHEYFDLVALDRLAEARVADLGCGSGRWATFVAPRCRELVVADFSDAILVARRNLVGHDNVVFVLADVLDLPFADDAFDFAYCIGVLHHTPVPALDATRRLAHLAPRLLVYLYYALDNRPAYYRALLRAVTVVRTRLARVRGRRARHVISLALAAAVYAPLGLVGTVGGSWARSHVPLADTYAGKSLRRLQQDAYDRFFTGIEQRFTRSQIEGLRDTFTEVQVSEGLPYWHFLCTR